MKCIGTFRPHRGAIVLLCVALAVIICIACSLKRVAIVTHPDGLSLFTSRTGAEALGVTVPYGALVTLGEEAGETMVTNGGRRGIFVRADWNGRTGWLFDGGLYRFKDQARNNVYVFALAHAVGAPGSWLPFEASQLRCAFKTASVVDTPPPDGHLVVDPAIPAGSSLLVAYYHVASGRPFAALLLSANNVRRSEIVWFNPATLRVTERLAIPTGYLTAPLVLENEIYYAARGIVGKVSIYGGTPVWQHDGLYKQKDTGQWAASFRSIHYEKGSIIFTDDFGNRYVVDDVTGKML